MASEQDGTLSMPCMAFVSHRHSQHALDKFFNGDSPESGTKIPCDTGLLAIVLQATLFCFFPGLLVELDKPTLVRNRRYHTGPQVTREYEQSMLSAVTDGVKSKSLEWDPELLQTVAIVDQARAVIGLETFISMRVDKDGRDRRSGFIIQMRMLSYVRGHHDIVIIGSLQVD